MGKTVRLTVVASEGAAEVLCSMLRAEQVPCFHRPTHLAAEGGFFGGADWREIVVDEAALERAHELLAAVEPLHAECIKCGRSIGDDGRWYPDGAGELVPYCAGCAEWESGHI